MMIANRKRLMLLAAIVLLTGNALAQTPVPKDGFVPDQKTAIRITEAVLPPICGCLARNKPFTATLDNGVWTVIGKQPKAKKGYIVFGGGEVEMRIDQHTGAIISCSFAR
jgi:hypothetical protein